MIYDLSDKTAVVTGGSRGIGKAIAKALIDMGATVAITARHEDVLNQTSEELGDLCHPFVCDQRNPEAVSTTASAIIESVGAPDILVNNAGTWVNSPVIELSLDQWNTVMETNLTGVFLTTKAFLPSMLHKERGDIIMISSMSGKKGDPGSSAYSASKFGLQGFSQALMYEVRNHNIRVSVINPSQVDQMDPPKGDFGPGLHLHAHDIASTVVHLCCLPGRTMIRDMDIYGTNP